MKTYGSNAAIHGVNIAFLYMSIATVILLVIAVFSFRDTEHTKNDSI